MKQYVLKQGATFHADGVFKVGSTPTSIAAYTVTSMARNGTYTDPHTLTVTKASDQGTHPGEFALDADTAAWAPGTYAFDVKFAASGDVKFTHDVKVVIQQPRTFVDP